MPDSYHQLLDATIQHLEELKARGVRFIPVSAENLAALAQPPAQAPPTRIAPEPQKQKPASPPKSTPSQAPTAFAPSVSPPATKVPATKQTIAPPPVAPPSLPGFGPASAPAVARPQLAPEAKAAAFADLRQRAMACVKCPHLAASRKNVVFGVGSLDAQLMFVGEAPGADEDIQGEPFVGAAGKLLTKIIQTMGLTRESVYIANILKCRPDTPGQSSGNRKPTPDEMETCIPFLHEQIDLIRPKVLVALGATAVEGLLGKTIGITRLRGNWQTYRGTPLMPTYHPAFLLRNQALTEKRKVWEDMLQVMERLGLAVSPKQQKFFLKES